MIKKKKKRPNYKLHPLNLIKIHFNLLSFDHFNSMFKFGFVSIHMFHPFATHFRELNAQIFYYFDFFFKSRKINQKKILKKETNIEFFSITITAMYDMAVVVSFSFYFILF